MCLVVHRNASCQDSPGWRRQQQGQQQQQGQGQQQQQGQGQQQQQGQGQQQQQGQGQQQQQGQGQQQQQGHVFVMHVEFLLMKSSTVALARTYVL